LTLQTWARGFERWTPDVNVVVLTGGKEEHAELIANRLIPQDFDVCVTSYEICLIEKSALKKFSFEYIVIDEAHRIKNVDSILAQIVRTFISCGRPLITGTPPQNNLKELFALLNFICPKIFSVYADLDAFLHKDDAGADGEEKSKKIMKALHKILRPFLLRREEMNIYIGLTEMQRKWYRSVLEKDIDAVNGLTGEEEGKTHLMNMVVQLRKVTCHPYLFDGAEPGPPCTTDEHLIENSGKMIILDKLFQSLKAKGSRVLIFSQMSCVLDILEDYCLFPQIHAHDNRIVAIDEYSKPESEKFIFLLTTRAGGLGINLTTVDIVILYNSYGPCSPNRIDKASGSVKERMLERAAQKLRLDQRPKASIITSDPDTASKDELLDMIAHGAEKIINSSDDTLINEDIKAIIQRGEERTAELNSKYEGLNLEDLTNFKSDSEDFRGGGRKSPNLNMLSLSKRERKINYSVDSYFKDTLRAGPSKTEKVPKMPLRRSRYRSRTSSSLAQLWLSFRRENLAVFKRLNGIAASARESQGPEDTPEKLEAERAAAQGFIDTGKLSIICDP
ncbi:hypothetical protein J3R83DRAFT_10876, partial [Lanmaoa asiatica]